MTSEVSDSTAAMSDFGDEPAFQPEMREGMAVNLEGYEGPLDILLVLARTQKVDLKQISILQLAEQYLTFIRELQDLKLEVAADYLVMAAWLAYLKSRLLLPPPPHDDGEVDPEELAARLVFRLQCLEAMRDSAAKLMARDLLGREVFVHGMSEGIRVTRSSKYQASLYELLTSYSTQRLRNYYAEWSPPKMDVLTLERARTRIERLLGELEDWGRLDALVIDQIKDPQKRRTTMASMFGAALEYVRDGRLEIQQAANFKEILVRRARPKPATTSVMLEEGEQNDNA
jgi:segregation and condensation protein A